MKILLKGVPDASEEGLVNFMEILTDTDVRILHFVPPVAVVETETETDLNKLNQKCATRTYMSGTLKAEKWKMQTLCVSNVAPTASEELLGLYFSNFRRSGGKNIASVFFNKDRGNALVTFENETDAERVLQRDHLLDGRKLSLQPYLGSLDTSEQGQHILRQGENEQDLGGTRINQRDQSERDLNPSRNSQWDQEDRDMDTSRVNQRDQSERGMGRSRNNPWDQEDRDMDTSRVNQRDQSERGMGRSRNNPWDQEERYMDPSRVNQRDQSERISPSHDCYLGCKAQPNNEHEPDTADFSAECYSERTRQDQGRTHLYPNVTEDQVSHSECRPGLHQQQFSSGYESQPFHERDKPGQDSHPPSPGSEVQRPVHQRDNSYGAPHQLHPTGSDFVETVMDNLIPKINQLQVLKEDGFDSHEKKCSVNIASNGVVFIKGPKDQIDQAKVDLYAALERVKSATVNLSHDLLRYAREANRMDRIREHLKEASFQPFCVSFEDDCLKVWTISQESAETAAEEVKTLFSSRKFKLQSKYQDVCKSSQFGVFLGDIRQDQGVLINHQSSAVECEGFKEDVETAIQSIKKYLESNKSLNREVTLSPAEVKFLDRHARKNLRDIESKAREPVTVWLNNDKLCVEIKGKQEVAEETENKLKDFLKSLCKTEVKIEEPGIQDFFRGQGLGLINAVESRIPCVLDITGTGQTRGTQGRGGNRRPVREDKGSDDGSPRPRVTVSQGNITDSRASVLVNVVGRELNLSRGALSKNFLRVGGEELQKALSKNRTPAEFGEVLITRTRGDLQCEYVYHAVCPSWKPRYGSKTVTDILSKCLTEANKHHCRSIALPSVGAGGLGYPTNVLIQAFKSALCNFCQNTKHLELKDIHLIIYDEQVFESFKDTFSGDWMNSTSPDIPETHSKGANSVRITVTTTSKHVEEVEKLIRRHVKDAYGVDEIRDHSLRDPPKALQGLIASLSGSVSIRHDGDKISIYGSKSAVDSATKDIFKCLHQNKPAAQKPSQLLKTKGVKAYMDAKAKETIYAPGHWKNFNKRDVPLTSFIDAKDEKYKLVDAGKQDTADITKLFTDSWPNCNVQVTKVQRVEHPELYQKFASRRQLFYSKAAKGKIQMLNPPAVTTTFQIASVDRYCRKEINECLLFHGTRNVSAILDSGLDFRVAGNGKFGKGIYMAECASLSYGFSSRGNFNPPTSLLGSAFGAVVKGGSGNTCMFVVRAVLGNCYATGSQGNYVRPPCMVSSCGDQVNCLQHGDRYDTVVGTAGYREFVIYDSAQCYPEYLITLS